MITNNILSACRLQMFLRKKYYKCDTKMSIRCISPAIVRFGAASSGPTGRERGQKFQVN